jgi:hypothetical protein
MLYINGVSRSAGLATSTRCPTKLSDRFRDRRFSGVIANRPSSSTSDLPECSIRAILFSSRRLNSNIAKTYDQVSVLASFCLTKVRE